MDEDRERLVARLTPEQLAAYDELRAKLKRELTDRIVQSVGPLLEGFGLDLEEFDEGFRNAVATGMATQTFHESMEESDGEAGGKGAEASEAEEG